jgi:RHS repeat-associated protein
LYVDDYNPGHMIPGDYNGDGLVDLLITCSYGYKILINKGGDRGDGCPIFESTGYYTDFNSTYSCVRTGDFNGDGLIDFLLCEKDSKIWWVAYNNGDLGFDKTQINEITLDHYSDDLSSRRDNVIVTDFNNDGKSDVIVFDAHDGTYDVQWFKSLGSGFTKTYSAHSSSDDDDVALNGYYTCGDFDGDGRQELMNYGWNCYDGSDFSRNCRVYSTPCENLASLVTSITNGINQKTNYAYNSLTNSSSGVYSKTVSLTYPLKTFTAPVYVVSQINSDNGLYEDVKKAYKQSSISYAYENAVLHLQGKGFLGFAKTTQINNEAKIEAVSWFNPATDIETSYYTVKNQTSDVYSVAGTTPSQMSTTTNTYVNKLFSNKHIFSYLSTSTSTDYLTNIKVTKTNTYDGTATVPYDGNGNLVSEDVAYGDNRKNYVTTSFKEYTNAGSYIENKPQLIETLKQHGDDAASYTSKVRYTYDGTKGSVLTKTDFEELATGKKVVSTYTYHPQYGLLTSISVSYPDKDYDTSSKTVTDKQGSSLTSYTYTDDGRFLQTKSDELTSENLFVTKYEYDGVGNLLSEEGSNGLVKKYEYANPFNGLSKSINPDGTWTAISTDWASPGSSNEIYVTASTSSSSAPVSKYFDQLGREVRSVTKNFQNKSVSVSTSYNSKGQVEWTTLPYFDGGTTVKKYSTYDDDGRVKSQYYDSNEQTMTLEYTASTTTVKTTYAGTGRYSIKTTDVWGNLKTSTDGKGNIVTYYYKSRGVPSTVTAAGYTTAMSYDDYGNRTTLADPSAGTQTYLYNSLGWLYQQTDDKGNKTSYTYDVLGRKTNKYYGSESTSYTYDGQLKGAVDNVTGSNGITKTFVYDTNTGRLTSRSEVINSNTFTQSYDYDNTTGNLVKTIYPSGFITLNEYDTYGYSNVTRIKDKDNKTIWSAADGNALGELVQFKLGETGSVYERTVSNGYDKYGSLETISTPNVMNLQRNYNSDTRNVNWRKNITTNVTENYGYDELDRLNSWGVGTAYSTTYSGITIDKKTDVATGNYTYQQGNVKLSSLPGAIMAVRKPQNITYNDQNKLTHIDEYEKGATTGYRMDFTYDDEGSRKIVVLKKDDASTPVLTRYYAFGNYEQEERLSGVRMIDYIGSSAIHVINGGADTMYYLHTDHQGSWVAVTNNKSASDIKEQSFDPWGRRVNPTTWVLDNASTGFPFVRGYTGHEHMDMFGLINMNGRVYDPALGLFLSPDNYVQKPWNSQSYNRYSYCLNNPLKYIDPDGLWSIGLGLVFGYDSHGFHIGFGAALDVGTKNIGVNINASHTWSTDGSNTTTFNVGANINLGIVGVGVNVGYSTNSMSGSTFSAYVGANIVAVGAGIGYTRSWDPSGRFVGATGYIGGYVGIPGLATYGGGYQWANGAFNSGWYNTQSLFCFNWRNGSFQGFDYNMNICSYNSKDPNNHAVLKTEHEPGDNISHSVISGDYNGNHFSISWGPAVGGQDLMHFIFGCKSQNNWDSDQTDPYGEPIDLSCVSVSKLYQYSKFADAVSGYLPYNILMFSCVGMTSAATYSGGMSYMGFSPYFLEFFAKNKW